MTIESIKDIFRPMVSSKLPETDSQLSSLFKKVSRMIERFIKTNKHYSGIDDFLKVDSEIEDLVNQIEKRYSEITT